MELIQYEPQVPPPGDSISTLTNKYNFFCQPHLPNFPNTFDLEYFVQLTSSSNAILKKQGLGRAAIKAREEAREAPLSRKQTTDAAFPSAVLLNRMPPEEAVAIFH